MGHLLKVKRLHSRLEYAQFSFNKCSIYTHDGASAKFSTNSHETDNSVATKYRHFVKKFIFMFLKTLALCPDHGGYQFKKSTGRGPDDGRPTLVLKTNKGRYQCRREEEGGGERASVLVLFPPCSIKARMDCACFTHNQVERGSVARVGVEQYTVLAGIQSQHPESVKQRRQSPKVQQLLIFAMEF